MRRVLLHFLLALAVGSLGIGAGLAFGMGRVGAAFWGGCGFAFVLGRVGARGPGPDRGPAPGLVVDPTGEIAYLRVRPGPVERTEADVPQVNVDFDDQGRLVGVEFVVWPPNRTGPAVPEAWPPYSGYEDEDEDEDEDDDKGEEWKQ